MSANPSVTVNLSGFREARLAANLSQQQIAIRACCSISYVRLLERGFQPTRSDVLPRVLAALDDCTAA
jgi:transcriptional regulator with XRE-family HTH domain